MANKGRSQEKYKRIAMSAEEFSTVYTVLLLLFFVPYAAERGGALFVAIAVPVCLAPLVLMPIMYSAVHRFSPLLYGRYHFFMPLSALIAALVFVLGMSAEENAVTDILLLSTGLLLFGTLFITYRYCSFSVRSRLTGVGSIRITGASALFATLGALGAVGTVCGFYYYDPATMYLNSAYVAGGMSLVVATVQYLYTFYDIPKLSGRRKQSVKSAFKEFYCGIKKRIFFSALLFLTGFATVAALGVYYAFCDCDVAYAPFIAAAAIVGAYALTSYFIARRIRKRSRMLSVIIGVLLILSAGSIAAARVEIVAVPCLFGGCALCGVAGALTVRQTKMRFLSVKQRMTSGTMFVLIRLAFCAALGITAAFCAGVIYALELTSDDMFYVYGFGAAAFCAFVGLWLGVRSSQRVAALPSEPDYELHTEEKDNTKTAGD